MGEDGVLDDNSGLGLGGARREGASSDGNVDDVSHDLADNDSLVVETLVDWGRHGQSRTQNSEDSRGTHLGG